MNSAKVLLDHLAPFHREQENAKVRAVWASTFGLELPRQEAELLEAFAIVMRLPSQVRRQVEALPDSEDKARLVAPLESVERVLALGLGTNVKSYTNQYNKTQEAYLTWTADALRRAGLGDPAEQADGVESLLADVIALESRIVEADDLPDFLREFLLRAVDGLRQALRHYRVTGSSGLLAEIDRIIGHTFRVATDVGEDAFRDAADRPEARDLWTIVGRLADLITVAGAPVLAATARLLEWTS